MAFTKYARSKKKWLEKNKSKLDALLNMAEEAKELEKELNAIRAVGKDEVYNLLKIDKDGFEMEGHTEDDDTAEGDWLWGDKYSEIACQFMKGRNPE